MTVIPEPSPGVSWFGRAVGFVGLGAHELVVVGAPLGNPDAFLIHTATHPGGPPLSSSFGTLGAAGRAAAQLGCAPALKGLSVHHAFLTFAPGRAPTFARTRCPSSCSSPGS